MHGLTARERLYYWLGWEQLAAALVSPIHATGEVLFSAHMAQHELLMVVAAPLLVMVRPLLAALWGIPRRARILLAGRTKTRWLHSPHLAFFAHAGAIWLWHLPAAWGLTGLEDQQLGGLIMWVPPSFIYLVVFLRYFVRWLHGMDRPMTQGVR